MSVTPFAASSPPHFLHLLTFSLPHFLTFSLPHFLTSSLPHFLTSSLPHFLTSSLPHFLTSSLQSSLHLCQFWPGWIQPSCTREPVARLILSLEIDQRVGTANPGFYESGIEFDGRLVLIHRHAELTGCAKIVRQSQPRLRKIGIGADGRLIFRDSLCSLLLRVVDRAQAEMRFREIRIAAYHL